MYPAHHELESIVIVTIVITVVSIILLLRISYYTHFFHYCYCYKRGVLVQCLAQMQQSGLSAIAITDGTDSNQLIGNFSVSDLR